MIKLFAPGLPPLVTKLTLIVTLPALVFVIVNLSIKALQFTGCVLCGLAVLCLFGWDQHFNGYGHWIPPILFETVRIMDGMPGCGVDAGSAKS